MPDLTSALRAANPVWGSVFTVVIAVAAGYIAYSLGSASQPRDKFNAQIIRSNSQSDLLRALGRRSRDRINAFRATLISGLFWVASSGFAALSSVESAVPPPKLDIMLYSIIAFGFPCVASLQLVWWLFKNKQERVALEERAAKMKANAAERAGSDALTAFELLERWYEDRDLSLTLRVTMGECRVHYRGRFAAQHSIRNDLSAWVFVPCDWENGQLDSIGPVRCVELNLHHFSASVRNNSESGPYLSFIPAEEGAPFTRYDIFETDVAMVLAEDGGMTVSSLLGHL
jgi:hypothetical protein